MLGGRSCEVFLDRPRCDQLRVAQLQLAGVAPPLQCTPPSSLTSSVSRAGPLPLRCDDEQVRRVNAAAAGEQRAATHAARRSPGDAPRWRAPHVRSRLTRSPPRRRGEGRPRPLSTPSRRSTACTPPKNRFERRNCTTLQAVGLELASVDAGLGDRRAVLEVHARRLAPPRARRGRGRRRRRSSAAAPSGCGWSRRCRAPARPRPSRITIDGAIMLGIRRPAGCRWKPSGLRSSSPITLLRWMPGARHDHAGALAVGRRWRCTRGRRRRAPRCASSSRAAWRGSARGSPPR